MAVRTTYRGRFWRLILVVATLLVFLPVNQERVAAQQDAAPTLLVVPKPGFGSILTDAEGWTLYRWDGDTEGVSNCWDACAVAWPPLLVADALIAPANLPGTLGFIDRGEEGWQVTFDNWPLYYFVRDVAAGDVNGEGSTGFGARWSVLAFAAPPALPAPPIIQQPIPPAAQAPPPTPRPAAPQPTARPIPPPAPPATAVPAPAAPPAAAAGAAGVEGPQFGNWGPNMGAPDQEGFGGGQYGPSAAPRADAPFGYGGAYAAPYPGAAPAPGVAPYYSYGGCQYDLRGNWQNEGRQTTGGYRPYSASVYVRQYRQWIHGQQDDGTGYYGQCVGNRLQLDVYRGSQYMGRQVGTIRGSRNYDVYPAPLYGDPYAAPFAPSPNIRNIVATFTWHTYYGSGTETWHRNYNYYDYGY